mgnify:CR=1 FL=1
MAVIGLIFLVLLVTGAPVAFAIGVAGFWFFMDSDIMPLSIGVQRIAAVSQSFPLLAVPFFVFAGHLMNESAITDRLFKFAHVTVAWMAGGLAQVSIIMSTLMGGVSGSAVADAAMEARVLGPQMISQGYSKGYSAAVIAMSSLITATIPPSIGLILYGYIGGVSIGRLFMAGIVPGILMMAVLMITAYVIAKRRNYVVSESKVPSSREVFKAAWDAKWALLFPVLLLVSLRGGVFTPSEVGAFAVVYAILVGTLAHRKLTLEGFKTAISQSLNDIGLIMFIILLSGMVGFAITFLRVPQEIAGTLLAGVTDPNAVVAIVLGMLFIAGLFVESTVLVLLLTPIFVPIITQIGFDPVHFGILMMTLVTFGSMTPPVGVAMYTVCSLLDVKVEDYVKESIPFVIAIMLLVTVLLFLPDVVLFVPRLAFG